MTADSDAWIFGYGSLVFRPAFPYLERRPGRVEGWVRRFWQASPDHRGTPESPGRVATVLAEPGAWLWGMAYRVAATDVGPVLEQLDFREKEGYERLEVPLFGLQDPAQRFGEGLMYVAGPANPNFVGPASARAIAEHVVRCAGPSGPNREYVLRLAAALREMGAPAEPTFDIEGQIHVILGGGGTEFGRGGQV